MTAIATLHKMERIHVNRKHLFSLLWCHCSVHILHNIFSAVISEEETITVSSSLITALVHSLLSSCSVSSIFHLNCM